MSAEPNLPGFDRRTARRAVVCYNRIREEATATGVDTVINSHLILNLPEGHSIIKTAPQTICMTRR